MSEWKSIRILGVRVAVLQKCELLSQVLAWCQQDVPRTITYVNAHCLNLAQCNQGYRDMLNQADLVYSDGIGVVWAARWLAGVRLRKITGRNWVADLCKLAAEQQFSLYLLGGRPGVATQARERFLNEYPGLNVLAARDGFFAQMSEADVLDEITSLQPTILLVGMGAPRQDLWLAANRERIVAPLCWSVGALFDFVAGIEQVVPKWLNFLALEWLWRLIVDPRGKWQRYLLGNPQFFLRVARQKFMPD